MVARCRYGYVACLTACLVSGILFAGTVRGSDEEVFYYRAYPNLLVILNRGSQMTVANDNVGDLDYDGGPTRYDLALKTVFRILNANGSEYSGHSTPDSYSEATSGSFRGLIGVEDEIYLSQRIGLIYYDNQVHTSTEAPFQVTYRTPNQPPFQNGYGNWRYGAIWDNLFALGPPAARSDSIGLPWNEVGDYFTRAITWDPDWTCRPKVVVIVTTPEDARSSFTSMPSFDNTTGLFVVIVGASNPGETRRIIRESYGAIPENRIAFFASAADVQGSSIFQDLVAQLQSMTFESV